MATKTRKDFSEMTQSEKAVAVAKDVLKHLKIIRASCGFYIHLTRSLSKKILSTDDAQEHIDIITKKCEVCGIGACFLSFIRLNNDATVEEVVRASNWNMRCKMRDAFSYSVLEDIERAFECGTGLKKNYKSDNRRLQSIMLNIVRNEGIFVKEIQND